MESQSQVGQKIRIQTLVDNVLEYSILNSAAQSTLACLYLALWRIRERRSATRGGSTIKFFPIGW